jgi:hypothetical protein
MKRALAATLILALLAGCAGSTMSAGRPPSATAEGNERRILVMIADADISRIDLRGARSGPYRQARGYPGTPAHIARLLDAVAADFGLKPVDGWPMRSLGVHCGVFEVEPGASVDAVIARLDADERVESVQRMQQFELQESSTPGAWDDPYLSLQRSLTDSGITLAHRWATGKGVRIAVIDTGVDVKHPDLRGQAVEVRNFISDGAGARDRHGTAVAGVIASVAGNRRGIAGLHATRCGWARPLHELQPRARARPRHYGRKRRAEPEPRRAAGRAARAAAAEGHRERHRRRGGIG